MRPATDMFKHREVRRKRIGNGRIQALRMRPGRIELRPGVRVAAREQRDVAAEVYQSFRKVRDYPFRSAIKRWGYGLV